MSSPPPTYTTIARALASVRMQCWNDSQLTVLDLAIAAIADDLFDINPRFDHERFKTMARYQLDHVQPDTQEGSP